MYSDLNMFCHSTYSNVNNSKETHFEVISLFYITQYSYLINLRLVIRDLIYESLKCYNVVILSG
jgi:hypothetical protein